MILGPDWAAVTLWLITQSVSEPGLRFAPSGDGLFVIIPVKTGNQGGRVSNPPSTVVWDEIYSTCNGKVAKVSKLIVETVPTLAGIEVPWGWQMPTPDGS